MVKHVLLSALLATSLAPAARAEKHVVASGTTLNCRLTQTLSTRVNFQGDLFSATVAEPLIIDGREVIPVGATVQGRIAQLEHPGRVHGVGLMRLSVESLTFPDGRTFPLNALLITAYGAEGARMAGTEGTVKGPSSRLKTLEEVGMGMGGGGFLGTIIGGFHGAVVGGALGGVAGFVDTMRKRGKDLTLPAGTELKYQLNRELRFER